jgi:putative Mn2+ efflux pump MntP
LAWIAFAFLSALVLWVSGRCAKGRSHRRSGCVTFAPLVGLAAGRSLVEAIGPWTEYLGLLVIGGYGLYVVYLDNLVAGLGLGVLRNPIFFAALTIGAISGLMALAGLKLGNVIGRYLPIRSDVLSGVALVFVAVTPNKPGAERT